MELVWNAQDSMTIRSARIFDIENQRINTFAKPDARASAALGTHSPAHKPIRPGSASLCRHFKFGSTPERRMNAAQATNLLD
jgi:hypothetical protein